jgi:hypothetical protein
VDANLWIDLLLFVWFWHQILVRREKAKAEGTIRLKKDEDAKV